MLPSQLLIPQVQAVLALADGAVFLGVSVGAAGHTVGEVVFNTSHTGYQEILTDPSYCRQIVTLTCPHIGNYGISDEDIEAPHIAAAGLVVKDMALTASNFRSRSSLPDYLKQQGTVAIANVDTRRLTRHLRTHGAQNGCILTVPLGASITAAQVQEAVSKAQAAPSMSGLNLAQEVSCSEAFDWTETEWALGAGHGQQVTPKFHVVVLDLGVKRNILRMLASRGCQVTVVPASTPAHEVLKRRPDGILLSNGPGDPQACTDAIEATKAFIQSNIPTFGICLGHQILALAAGARTFKMKFGHHGANHPVKNLKSGRVSITSQNHGFAVDEKTLPASWQATHVSLFDGTLQGLTRAGSPVFSFQGHPEASPGPHDIADLFDDFIDLMAAHLEKKNA